MNLKLGQTLLTLQNSKSTDIPEYAADQLQLAKEELKRLDQEIRKINEEIRANASNGNQLQPFRRAKFALLLDQVYRIKRFLLIYHNFRCDRIEDQFWHFGGDLNNDQKGNISEPERAYFPNYKGLMMDYIEEVGLDLTIDLEPPLQTEVEVRMLKDCGELLTEHGLIVKLQKNACLFMSRRLIEPYVKQGYAVILR